MPEIEGKLIALGIVLPGLATVFVGFRFWARRFRHTKLGLGDYLIVPALISVWGLGITQIIGRLPPLYIVYKQSRTVCRIHGRELGSTYWGAAEWQTDHRPPYTRISKSKLHISLARFHHRIRQLTDTRMNTLFK